MLFVSIFTSDRKLDPELWATIWQGNPPPSLNLIGAYNMSNDKRVYIWEGESVLDIQFMDRFNEIGVMETSPASDRTVGWRMAFNKELDAFEEWFSSGRNRSGNSSDNSQYEIDSAIDLRRRGMLAPNRHAARLEATKWREEQQQS